MPWSLTTPPFAINSSFTPNLALQIAPFALAEGTYKLVLRWDNPLNTHLDVAILQLQRQGQVDAMAQAVLS